jgi:hypothetical protein
MDLNLAEVPDFCSEFGSEWFGVFTDWANKRGWGVAYVEWEAEFILSGLTGILVVDTENEAWDHAVVARFHAVGADANGVEWDWTLVHDPGGDIPEDSEYGDPTAVILLFPQNLK